MYDTIVSWFKKESKKISCKKCGVINLYIDRVENLHTCTNCLFHNYIAIEDRMEFLLDGEFTTYNDDLAPVDILQFKDVKKYKDRIKENIKKTHKFSSVTTGYGEINGVVTNISVFDFKFMGGSLGRIEGQKIYECIQKAIKYKTPLIIISSSGGARMQESAFSLMQMAKTSSALAELSEAGLPYVSLLTNPTMGGVSASFAFLGDVIISEPEAVIGFAGKRVIEQTINEKLPLDFQTSEYLLQKGLIDGIIERKNQKDYISRVFSIFTNTEREELNQVTTEVIDIVNEEEMISTDVVTNKLEGIEND